MNLHGRRFNQHTPSFSNYLPLQCLLHYWWKTSSFKNYFRKLKYFRNSKLISYFWFRARVVFDQSPQKSTIWKVDVLHGVYILPLSRISCLVNWNGPGGPLTLSQSSLSGIDRTLLILCCRTLLVLQCWSLSHNQCPVFLTPRQN